MSETWHNLILKEFIPGVHPVTLVIDPDGLLGEETLLQQIEARGFSVLLYDDPVEFRFTFETQFRHQWESKALRDLVVVTRTSDEDRDPFPYDLSTMGHRLSVHLSDVFPYLSASILRSLPSPAWQRLYEAQRQNGLNSPQGEINSADFVLHHVFGIAPETAKEPYDLLNLLLRRHYGEMPLPAVVEKHLLNKLRLTTQFAAWHLERLLSDRAYFFAFLQDRWLPFLDHLADELGLETQSFSTQDMHPPVLLPFHHESVRVYMDNLFAERLLSPVKHPSAGALARRGDWIALGLDIDPQADSVRRISLLLKSCRENLPSSEAAYISWFEFANRWAILNTELNGSESLLSAIQSDFVELQAEVDRRFQEWVIARYGGLYNTAPTPPVMVHHIPRFLARQLTGDSRRKVALIVVDGMSFSQWNAIKRVWQDGNAPMVYDEHGLFAWVPSLTSISRQALFSGRIPRSFEPHILTTANEGNYWHQFWADQKLPSQQVAYAKSVNDDNLGGVENILSDSGLRVVGLVVDTVDKIMHGEQLGARGMQNQVVFWAKQGLLRDLVEKFLGAGFDIWITADHGNTEAVGIGRPTNEGVLADQKGERVRVYGEESLRSRFAQEYSATIQWTGVGLPASFFCLIPEGRHAFITEKRRTVTHGGISLDELIVPLISVKRMENT